VYVNDLAAVRLHLDKKNDNSKVNTTSIYLIGVGDAAAIGMAWIYAEWNRPSVAPMFGIGAGAQTYAFVPQLRPNLIKTPAGNDIAAAIWISPTVPKAFPKATLQNWVRDPVAKLRSTPMMFLVGDKDDTGKRDAETYFRDVLVARPPKGSSLNDADKTYLLEIKGGGQQKGLQMLGKADLKVEDLVVKYMVDQVQKKRPTEEPTKREYKDPYFIDLRFLGVNP